MDESVLDLRIDQRSAVPLYEQICQQIRQKIESRQLQPGTPLPTNQQLRTRLRVAYKTAQQAMSTLSREGYVTRQSSRGTVVKGIPRRGVVGIYSHIDLVSQDGQHEYYRLITGHLSRLLEGNSRVHRLYLGSAIPGANTASEDLLRHMSGGTLCGTLLVNLPPQIDELVRLGRTLNVPVIALSSGGQADYSVQVDHRGYIREAAAYLKKHGRHRVGLIYNRSGPELRQEGIVASMLEQGGCAPNESWIIGCAEDEKGGYEADERIGYEAAKQLPLHELDGLIIEDDVMAVGVDRCLSELQVNVPRDLTVATFWNHGSRLRLTLPFERFELDVAKQARLSFQLMQDAIDGLRIAEPHVKIVPVYRASRHPEGMSATL